MCFREGINTERPDSRVLGISPFSPPATTGSTPKAIGDPGTNRFGAVIADEVPGLITEVATKGAVGATWGVAVDRSTGLLWNSAVIRRHLGLGPEGIGGLYVYTRDGTQVASFDLENLATASDRHGPDDHRRSAGRRCADHHLDPVAGVAAGDGVDIRGGVGAVVAVPRARHRSDDGRAATPRSVTRPPGAGGD